MNSRSNDLGEIRQTFRPRLANLCAGAILGLALVVGGISAALYFALRDDPKPLRDTGDYIAKYTIIAVLGIGAPAGGIVLLIWMKRLIGHRVSIFESGFSYSYRGANEIVPWAEVMKINEVFTEEQLKVLKVPGAVIKNLDRSFVVFRKDGKEFRFTVNSIDDIPRLGAVLEEARVKHNIAWEQIRQ